MPLLAKKDLNDLYQLFMLIQQYNNSGLPITEALKLYEKQTPRLSVKKILADVEKDIGNGLKIAAAFAKHPDFFPNYIVEMMRVDESTGQSRDIYEDIIRTLEQEIDLRRNISSQKGTLIFLGALLVLAIAIVVFIVLPSVGDLMTDLNMELPFFTKLVIGVGTTAQAYWWLILLILAGIIIGVRFWAKHSPRQVAKLILRIPLYGPIVYNTIQYRFALIFSLCCSVSRDLMRNLELTQKAVDNIMLADLLSAARKDLTRDGTSLSMALQRHNQQKVLDESFYVFLQAGEKGDIVQMLRMRADFFKKQLIVASQKFSQDLQNFIMVPIAVLIISILLAVYYPIIMLAKGLSTGGMGM